MIGQPRIDIATANEIALKSLAFLAEDAQRLQHFMAQTGIDVDTLRHDAGAPYLQAAVLDYLARDESLLLVFAANSGTDPANVVPALHVLQNA